MAKHKVPIPHSDRKRLEQLSTQLTAPLQEIASTIKQILDEAEPDRTKRTRAPVAIWLKM
jgi:hypothetical protein